jgi:hypothetical protein
MVFNLQRIGNNNVAAHLDTFCGTWDNITLLQDRNIFWIYGNLK